MKRIHSVLIWTIPSGVDEGLAEVLGDNTVMIDGRRGCGGGQEQCFERVEQQQQIMLGEQIEQQTAHTRSVLIDHSLCKLCLQCEELFAEG